MTFSISDTGLAFNIGPILKQGDKSIGDKHFGLTLSVRLKHEKTLNLGYSLYQIKPLELRFSITRVTI